MENWRMALPEGAMELLGRLRAAGHEGWAVGGCVRDALLGLEPKDYDLCTDATPEQMRAAFAGLRVIETGIAHGTLTVIADGTPYEVTTYRVDGAYTDHRRPDSVEFVREVKRDLMRRDFTINAMAYSPEAGLLDCFGGREDLRNGVIRCVGEPGARFDEDALRILRALRFAAVYGFTVEDGTARAARERKGSLGLVARERVTAEMSKLLCGRAAERIVCEFGEVIEAALGVQLHVRGLDGVPAELPLRLAHALQYGSDAERALGALRLDRATERAVRELIASADRACPQGDAAWRHLLHDLGQERALQLARWKGWPLAGARAVLTRGDCWSLRQLAVTGRDLTEMGMEPGRQVGCALEALLEAVMDGRVENERGALLALAKKQAGRAGK